MPDVHQFDPREDIREDEVYVVARCVCGWEGNAFPQSEQGYEDAEVEFVHHQDASRHGLT
ncbi:MAG: hypothetical protein KY462_10960 [Actinobacteria bacterium]|nr:hypothetical protein [Actinomycetota bacterium]